MVLFSFEISQGPHSQYLGEIPGPRLLMTALTVFVTFVFFFLSIFLGYITELKNIYQTSQRAITDDETTLHKFCVKLETVMRHEQKGRY